MAGYFKQKMKYTKSLSALIFLIACKAVFSAPAVGYVKATTPIYPRSAAILGMYGTVLITVTVGADGTAESASIEKSSGYKELDEAALTAAKSSTYLPPKDEQGNPCKAIVITPFRFLAEDEHEESAPGKLSERYEFFLNKKLPSMLCSEVVRKARRFQKANPSAHFNQMPLFQATNEYLAQNTPQRNLTKEQYTNVLLSCIKNEGNTYIKLVNHLFD